MALEGWRFRAAQFFFLIIFFGLQIFSVPCSKGKCSSPVEALADYIYSNKLANKGIVKALLYPSAFLTKAESLLGDGNGFSLPDWDNLLKDLGFKPNRTGGFMGYGFLLGCAMCYIGAFVSAFGPSYISPGGMLLILGYIYIVGNNDPSVHLLPMFSLAMFCSIAAFEFGGFLKTKVNGTLSEEEAAKKEG